MADDKPSIEDLLAAIEAGPPAGAGMTLRPIGVPEGVMGDGGAVVPFTSADGSEARYFEGDEFALLAGIPPEQIEELQYRMRAAGLIGKNDSYLQGRLDDTTIAAFAQVLSHANRTGMNPEMALQDLSTAQRIGQTEEVAPYLTPDPAAVRQGVKQTVSSILRRDVTEDELPALMQQYLSYDRQGYDADVAASTATGTVQDVDPAARFVDYLEQRYRPEIERGKGIVDLSANQENLMGSIFSMDRAIG